MRLISNAFNLSAIVQQAVGLSEFVAELHAQFAESAKLEQAIKANLRGLGYGG
jgi:hypothetical protein